MKDNNILMMADTAKATFPWGAELNIPLNGIPENLNEIVNHAIQEEKEQYYKKWEKIVRIHNQQWCGEQTVEPYLHIYIPGGKDPHGKQRPAYDSNKRRPLSHSESGLRKDSG